MPNSVILRSAVPGGIVVRLDHWENEQFSRFQKSRTHLIQHDAESPDIGPFVDGLSSCLLGTHIAGRAQEHARLGRRPAQRRRVGIVDAFGRVTFESFRQPEIEHFHRTVFGDHDVRGFQVAVDDAFCVRRIEPCRNLRGNVDRLFELESASLDPL